MTSTAEIRKLVEDNMAFAPSPDQGVRQVRTVGIQLMVDIIRHTPACRDRSLALTAVEDAMMRAVRGMHAPVQMEYPNVAPRIGE